MIGTRWAGAGTMERDSISEGLDTLLQSDAFGDPLQTLIRYVTILANI